MHRSTIFRIFASKFKSLLDLSPKINKAWFRANKLNFVGYFRMYFLSMINGMKWESILFLEDSVMLWESQSTRRWGP